MTLFVAREGNQAAAKQTFGFTRAYTKQKQMSRSDDAAKQQVFVSAPKRKETKRLRSRKILWIMGKEDGKEDS